MPSLLSLAAGKSAAVVLQVFFHSSFVTTAKCSHEWKPKPSDWQNNSPQKHNMHCRFITFFSSKSRIQRSCKVRCPSGKPQQSPNCSLETLTQESSPVPSPAPSPTHNPWIFMAVMLETQQFSQPNHPTCFGQPFDPAIVQFPNSKLAPSARFAG